MLYVTLEFYTPKFGVELALYIKMNCPKCQEALICEQYRKNNYHFCFYCEGLWLKKSDIEKHKIIRYFHVLNEVLPHQCPACVPSESLSLIAIKSCKLEYCKSCGGVFFDRGELEVFSATYKNIDSGTIVSDGADMAWKLWRFTRFVSLIFKLMKKVQDV